MGEYRRFVVLDVGRGWARIKLDLLTNQLEARRVNDGHVISDIIYMLKIGRALVRLSRCLRPRRRPSLITRAGGACSASFLRPWSRSGHERTMVHPDIFRVAADDRRAREAAERLFGTVKQQLQAAPSRDDRDSARRRDRCPRMPHQGRP